MHNDYLQILGLTTGASEQDIKSAYRRLAKKYHPDINSNEEARQQFLKATEAYKFLMDVGPRPNQEYVGYDYNPYQEKYDQWRESAKAYARERAAEEAAYQQNLLGKIFSRFSYINFVILIFNFVIVIDNFLPEQAHEDKVLAVSQLHYRQSPYSGLVHMYDQVLFTNFELRVEKNAAKGLQDNRAMIYTSPLLNFIKYAEVKLPDGLRQLYPEYDIYYVFRLLVPLIFCFCVAYFFLPDRHVNKITVLVAISILAVIQLAMIIGFSY
jgi:hypothetical protein